jgi:hypothetical protein
MQGAQYLARVASPRGLSPTSSTKSDARSNWITPRQTKSADNKEGPETLDIDGHKIDPTQLQNLSADNPGAYNAAGLLNQHGTEEGEAILDRMPISDKEKDLAMAAHDSDLGPSKPSGSLANIKDGPQFDISPGSAAAPNSAVPLNAEQEAQVQYGNDDGSGGPANPDTTSTSSWNSSSIGSGGGSGSNGASSAGCAAGCAATASCTAATGSCATANCAANGLGTSTCAASAGLCAASSGLGTSTCAASLGSSGVCASSGLGSPALGAAGSLGSATPAPTSDSTPTAAPTDDASSGPPAASDSSGDSAASAPVQQADDSGGDGGGDDSGDG